MKNGLLSIGMTALLLCACQTGVGEEDVFKHQDTYLGDNSEVLAIVDKLQHAKQFDSMKLQTKQQPYGITLRYQTLDSIATQQKMVIHHATFLFTLIRNVETMSIEFGDVTYTLTKSDLETLYDTKLSSLNNQEKVLNLLGEHEQEAIKQLL